MTDEQFALLIKRLEFLSCCILAASPEPIKTTLENLRGFNDNWKDNAEWEDVLPDGLKDYAPVGSGSGGGGVPAP